jgi:hypothetical protein
MSAVLRETLPTLSIEQLQQAVDVLQTKADLAADEGRHSDNAMLLTVRKEMLGELTRRNAEEASKVSARPACGMIVTSHFAVRSLYDRFPTQTADQLMAHSEDILRTRWNEAFLQNKPESQATQDWPQEYPFDPHTEHPPTLRPVSPLAIIYYAGEEPTRFETSAPPINVWWAAEDRIKNDPIGSWELVWRQYHGEMIHEGWVQRVSQGRADCCACMHYITVYRGGTPSPLPLSSS